MTTHTLISPLRIPQSKIKEFTLNLNIYRNAHYQTLNTVKINYKNYMKDQIIELPKFNKIKISYYLYPASCRRTDLGNVISIHKKFFEDALTEFNIISDDDYTVIVSNHEYFGEVDKQNPRVEIIIEEVL